MRWFGFEMGLDEMRDVKGLNRWLIRRDWMGWDEMFSDKGLFKVRDCFCPSPLFAPLGPLTDPDPSTNAQTRLPHLFDFVLYCIVNFVYTR